jgi:hypothetical protein
MTTMKWLAGSVVCAALALAGCDKKNPEPDQLPVKTDIKVKKDDHGHNHDDHDHGAGPHGGTIVELGKYHGEFTVDHKKKEATLYIYDGAIKKLVPLTTTKFTLSIAKPKFQVEMKAVPQEGDPTGKSSRFVATHEEFGKEAEYGGTISGEIDGKPYVTDFIEKEHDHKDHKDGKDQKDEKGKDDKKEEKKVFLTPGGKYTAADIAANGNVLPSDKFKGIKSNHDIKPAAGDKLCPITKTKANESFQWVINGKTYEVCCPPCLEELVEMAKTNPDQLKEPGEYIKK